MIVGLALWYLYAGIAIIIMLLALYLFYASNVVFTSDSVMWKSVAYVTALLDAWFIGVIFGTLSSNDVCGCEENTNESN